MHRAIGKVKSKRKQLPEQSEKGTDQSENGPEQSETITDAVGYYWSSKRGRVICSILCSGSRLHRHDCWAYGARVVMKCVGSSVDMHDLSRWLFSPMGFGTATVTERFVPAFLFSSSRAVL